MTLAFLFDSNAGNTGFCFVHCVNTLRLSQDYILFPLIEHTRSPRPYIGPITYLHCLAKSCIYFDVCGPCLRQTLYVNSLGLTVGECTESTISCRKNTPRKLVPFLQAQVI